MAEFNVLANVTATVFNISDGLWAGGTNDGNTVEFTDGDPLDNQFETTESLNVLISGSTNEPASYLGKITYLGNQYPAFAFGGFSVVFGLNLNSTDAPTFASLGPLDTSALTVDFCFASGTRIATAVGETAVEQLEIGDRILCADGGETTVKWIGRQTAYAVAPDPRLQPVRIKAGALGNGVPHSDLTVTADHGLILDGLVINASALVNGRDIAFVPFHDLATVMTYYHVETEAHEVILANGAAAETFVDVASRRRFDNYADYEALYGTERVIPELQRPRISAQRHLPQAIRSRLGIEDRPALKAIA